ncbi:hypothetical protein C8J57DRAFT_1497042 [Mycena rebaudengoi]|nr:hypothetical protein C8J57DRAFT_1497042 [Mycena rebaudengoi]
MWRARRRRSRDCVSWGPSSALAPTFRLHSTLTANIAYIYLESKNTTRPIPSGADSVRGADIHRPGADGTGEALLDPLFAIPSYLSTAFTTSTSPRNQDKAAIMNALGYTGLIHSDGLQSYTQPSLAEPAVGFWRGVSYTVTGIGLLSRTKDTVPRGRQRNDDRAAQDRSGVVVDEEGSWQLRAARWEEP